MVPGACEGMQEASKGTSSFLFHCLASWEQELSIHLQVMCLPLGAGRQSLPLPSFHISSHVASAYLGPLSWVKLEMLATYFSP